LTIRNDYNWSPVRSLLQLLKYIEGNTFRSYV